jgi:type IV secretory pathway VirJ component
MTTRVAAAIALALALHPRVAAAQTETVTDPTFGRVRIYAPAGAPNSVVLFVSGDGGWNLGVVAMAGQLRDAGALVVGIDIRSFLHWLSWSDSCTYPAGELEDLSRNVQLHRKLPVYKRPMLVGYSSGATLVYAALASAPPETFAGAISLAFCPDIQIRPPLCEMRGLQTRRRADRLGYDVQPFAGLKVPWMVLQGEVDQVCRPEGTRAFVAATGGGKLFSLPKVGHGFGVPGNWASQLLDAYRAVLSSPHPDESMPHASAPAVADLPLVEVSAAGGGAHADEIAILLSGDGGWAEIDKAVASALAAAGVPTVGWSSLTYFWTPRTPDGAAADLARVIAHYTQAWRRTRVTLIGYSFGADVLPFLAARLPADALRHVSRVALLGLSPTASFEFHVAEWLGRATATEYKTVPETERLAVPVLCIRGAGESDSACSSLRGRQISVVTIGSDHHFSGEYRRVAEAILAR